jgi:hypothetical protein
MIETHVVPVEDEPKTPMWLPALGATLFVAAGLWWAVTPSAPAAASTPAPSASEQAPPATAPAAAAAQPPAIATTAAARPAPPNASASGRPGGSAPTVNPALQDRLNQMRQRLQNRGAGGQH